jgi:hypothetical protein
MAKERTNARRRSFDSASGTVKPERWWPVVTAIAIVAALYSALPSRYHYFPVWLVPAVLLGLSALLVLADRGGIDRQQTWLRVVTGTLISVMTLVNLGAAVRLVLDILHHNTVYTNDAAALLAKGGVIWATNVIAFGLWYWHFDRGGAAARAHQPQPSPAFVFPEMQYADYVTANWVPRFVDYLSLAFWTATAFSPADVSPIKPWAKLLMMLEAAGSLALGVLVIARAINVLPSG